jgi:hypothetical protein
MEQNNGVENLPQHELWLYDAQNQQPDQAASYEEVEVDIADSVAHLQQPVKRINYGSGPIRRIDTGPSSVYYCLTRYFWDPFFPQ